MYIIVCYDIVQDRRRTRLLNRLRGELEHVQRSVLEGEISERGYLELMEDIRRIMDLQTDTVRVYRACQRCQTSFEHLGTAWEVDTSGDDIII